MIYKAQVVNNDDSKMNPKDLTMYRIQVRIGEKNIKGVWAYLMLPYVGVEKGMVFIPDMGSWVWVTKWRQEWVCLGCCPTKGKTIKDITPKKKVIVTDKFIMTFDDDANELTITVKSGGKIILGGDDGSIIIGEKLLSKFNNHMHPTSAPGAPTMMPLPPNIIVGVTDFATTIKVK